MRKFILAALISTTLAAPVMASDISGFRLEAGGVGQTTNYEGSADASGYGLRAGYDVNRFVDFSIDYFDTDLNSNSEKLESTFTGIDAKTNIGYTIDVSKNFQLKPYGSIGYQKMKSESNIKTNNSNIDSSDSSLILGAGIRMTAHEHISVTLDYVVADYNNIKVGTAFLGAGYKF